ncbi:MAG: hypothetical protein E6K14_07020 [Methanobacteriota archaeon]|nr:MAG: hypothetical protein E6K14_07020 [Euryarchaeota archaeon]
MIETYNGERVLFSYDATGASRAAAVQVCRIIFGRRRVDTNGVAHDEKGFIDRSGVVWIGQSVFILPPRDGEELATKLGHLGVRVAMAPVTITLPCLERFRRPAKALA